MFGRADLVTKISRLDAREAALLRRGQAVLACHHLAAASRTLLDAVSASGATLIGYEVIEDRHEDLPILHAMSEIAGQLAVHVAAQYLETRGGGRGILLGGSTGIPPAHVVILGAGVVGQWAARTAAGNRAQVTILDSSHAALRRAEAALGRSVITQVAHPLAVSRATAYADALIGAVLVPGERAPIVVTKEQVEGMKSGSVIIDVSIDQGGCVETSRPTTIPDPIFVTAGVTHYAVPNMASAVARTASLALTYASLPFVQALADQGIEPAIVGDPGLAAGVYTYGGELVSEGVARAFGIPSTPLADVLGHAERPGRIHF